MDTVSGTLDASIVSRSEWSSDFKSTKLDIKTSADHLKYRTIYLKISDETISATEILFPDDDSSIILTSWPESVPVPKLDTSASYHPVMVMGKEQLQPRKTLCYGHEYNYSNRTHPVESKTPADISRLFEITNNLYGMSGMNKKSPMCLVNNYANCYEAIGSHSDDTKNFSLDDVICWVTGCHRRMIFRTKSTNVQVLNFMLPPGLYIMRGKKFQANYKHEIPRMYESSYRSFVKYLPSSVKSLTSLEKAAWMTSHSDEMLELLPPTLAKKFDKWNVDRTSFTIRYFV